MIGASLVRMLAGRWAGRRLRRIREVPPLHTLHQLLGAARLTRFGREHGFDEILGAPDFYERFRLRVPIMDYDSWVRWLGAKSPADPRGAMPLVDEAWPGAVDMFCLSSGTTSGRTKYIPYSREMAAVNQRAALDFFAFMLRCRPSIAPPLNRYLYMSGSTRLRRDANGVLAGDMSGLTKFLAPGILDHVSLPTKAISALEPWSRRLEAMVDLCLRNPRIGMISGIPIWQLTLLEAVREKAGTQLSEVIPQLKFLVHSGMSMAPYRDRLRALTGPDVLFLEIYAASETGISAFRIPGEEGMRFRQNYQVFYEFENPAGDVLLSRELESNIPYSLIVSSCSGLWRYRIGDIVVFRGTDPLILDYVTRDKTTSAFDEKITEKELERAMAAMDSSFQDYAMGPDVDRRRHVWFLLGKRPDPVWLERLDDFLRRHNQDYDDYRDDGRIEAPTMLAVPKRRDFLKAAGREEGGQRKFPRLLSPDETTRLFELFSEDRS